MLVFVVALTLAGLGLLGCSPVEDVLAGASFQGPVVPTRALPSPTATATVTPIATATSTDTPTPEPTRTATTTPTDEATVEPTATLAPTEVPTEAATPTSLVSPSPAPTDPPVVTPETTAWVIADQPISHTLIIGAPLRETITSQQPQVLAGFRGSGGQTIDVTMERDSGDLDAFLIVQDAVGRELARGDDLNPTDTTAAIRGLTLPSDGDYLIVASRYGQRFGNSIGDFTLNLTLHNPTAEDSGTIAEPIAYDELRTGTITNARFEYVYTFEGQAGDLISLQASESSGNLDTSITLTDNFGNTLARNDDDISNTSTNAALRRVLLPEDGYYSIVVTRFQGQQGNTAGEFRFKLTLEQREADEGGRLRFAVLNPLQSGTIREDGSLFTDFFVGDQLDEENEERRYQALLTFVLPEAPADAAIEAARFVPDSCSNRGSGFNTGLVVYHEDFGVVSQSAALADAGPGAQALGELTDCIPLDITATIARAYAQGRTTFQMRLVLPDAPQNRETDAVGLAEPRLSVLFDQPPGE